MNSFLRKLWLQDTGVETVEYATILATMLLLVIGTIRLVGVNTSGVFSTVNGILEDVAHAFR
jgi:Flp pilus assembly pilin Flp